MCFPTGAVIDLTKTGNETTSEPLAAGRSKQGSPWISLTHRQQEKRYIILYTCIAYVHTRGKSLFQPLYHVFFRSRRERIIIIIITIIIVSCVEGREDEGLRYVVHH